MKKAFILTALLFLFPVFSLAGDPMEIKSWKPEGKITIHNKDDLWEYIDGAADQFHSYGFRMLRSRDFSKGDLLMTVDIYDMGSPLNAFGIYSTERPRDVNPLYIGTEAVVLPPAYCLLLKDRFYIKVQMIQGDLDDDTGKEILSALDATIDGSSTMPDELGLLPKKGRIKRSESYINKNYMGLAELNNIIFADYESSNGNEYRYFLVIIPQGETPAGIWEILSGKWNSAAYNGRLILHRDIPYEGKIGVIRVNDKIFGVSGVTETDEMFQRLEDMVASSAD